MKTSGVLSPAQAKKKIKFLPFNRDSEVRQDLLDSMKKYGFLSPIVLVKTNLISGTDDLYVVDGQHRLKSAIFAGLDVHYIISSFVPQNEGDIVQLVAAMNTTSKKWKMKDYVHAFMYMRNPHYIELNQLSSAYNFTLNSTAAILQGIRNAKTSAKKSVEEGKFIVKSKKHFLNVMDLRDKLAEIVSGKYHGNKLPVHQVRALSQVMYHKSFDEKRFIRNYKKNMNEVSHLTVEDYVTLFTSWI